MTFRSYLLLGLAALAIGGLSCSDPCGELRDECSECGDGQAACEEGVNILSELGGEEACQEQLDAGGVACAGQGGGA